jgi:hypothetical protein
MARPIFLIGFPLEADNAAVHHVQQDLSVKLEDEYHVIAYKVPGLESIDFKVLNAVGASSIEIEELIQTANAFAKRVLEEQQQKVDISNILNEQLEQIKNNPEQDGKI